MTKPTKRTQTGGSWTDWFSSGNATAAPPAPGTADPSTLTDAVTTPENGKKTWAQKFGWTGGSRRRRRCTKKHSHSSACKRKSKGRKSYKKR